MSGDQSGRYGIIRLGSVLLGVPITQLIEVFPMAEITPLPQSGANLLGGIELRGQLIPLLDLYGTAAIAAPSAPDALGVIIESEGRQLGFRVTEILGIANVKPSDVTCLEGGAGGDSALFFGMFRFQEQFVSIMKVDRLFALPDVQSSPRRALGETADLTRRPPLMTFEAGGALFAVPAVEVYAAVPRQTINATAMTAGPCLGEITYHDRRVPVICPVKVLGIGQSAAKVMSEIVVLRFPDDQVLGLAVDAIHDIRSYAKASIAQVPLRNEAQGLIEKVFVREGGAQIFAIDVPAIRSDPSIVQFANLSKKSEKSEDTASEPTSGGRLTLERERYLIVEADRHLAVPLLQVSYIMEPPEAIVENDVMFPGFKGYFGRLGETVALVDLRETLGKGKVASDTAKVLLTGRQGDQVGFLVDRVLSIEVSQWREKAEDTEGSPFDVLVQLGTESDPTVLPFCDLDGLVAARAQRNTALN